jgi:hypothetical protein
MTNFQQRAGDDHASIKLRRLIRPVGPFRYLIPMVWLLFRVMELGHNDWRFYAGLVRGIV